MPIVSAPTILEGRHYAKIASGTYLSLRKSMRH